MTERSANIYQIQTNKLHISSPRLAVSDAEQIGQIHYQENGCVIVLDRSVAQTLMCLLREMLPQAMGPNFEIQLR